MDKYLHTSFHALGDPTRLAVVERLLEGPASVSELAEPHPMALPAFTKHLGVLERAGLIRTEKKGRVRTCFIHMPTIHAIDQWVTDRRAMWESRLDRLAEHIDKSRKD
ncbi:metalloregulator ArsR/SmtB family transcription factor [Roseibium sp. SCPC15]|jgi:DNA-binding transcriptional ArsR family regulator|uniref:ArsR/SmtB family transcription factor n=1 Tax=Roseibium sp. SCP15 TaxID=3141376 RepID=UPI0033376C3F